ncbi:MAG: hypothetical protein K8R28_06115, partial [Desulfobacterales bacterium]|nr:hypothetical protein [Desulfobacterales bacterium]
YKIIELRIGFCTARKIQDKIIKLSFDRIPFVGDCLTSPQMKSTLASHSAKTGKDVSNFDGMRCQPFNSPFVDDTEFFFVTCVISLGKKRGKLFCLSQTSFVRFFPHEWTGNLRLILAIVNSKFGNTLKQLSAIH